MIGRKEKRIGKFFVDFASVLLFSAIFGTRFLGVVAVEAKSWTTTEVVSTESNGDSRDTSLAVDSAGNVHVAWHDHTDYAGSGTDYDIFYKRFEVSPPPVEPPPVGGIWIPVDKLSLLAPWIALALTITLAIP